MDMACVLDKARDEYILKRIMLLETMEAPTISDVKKNFGEELAEIYFSNCHLSFCEDLGLQPPLKGAIGGDLWTSPSDLLMGKLCLKPPLTSTHIKALTHQGILDIGSQIEKLFWNQLEMEKAEALAEQERILGILCEMSTREAVAEARAKMLGVFRRQRLELINEMDELCKEEMRRMEMKYYVDLQDELKEQARALEEYYEALLEEERAKGKQIVVVESYANLEEIEAGMILAFHRQLQKAEIFARFEIQKHHTKCKEKLKSLQHELECRNLANMMYLLCAERKKCAYEKVNTEIELKKEIMELTSLVKEKEDEIGRITAERDKHRKEVELREKALLEIIKEFQKFINFALKAVPKQAEYLLSAEKLMVFELTDALSKVPKEDDDHDRNFLWNRTPDTTGSSGGSINVKDGHDCLQQPEVCESELSVGQFLPGFYYNEQLYVREDFRNMVSQGIKISEENMLWTRHVQDIMDRLEQPCQSCIFSNNDGRVLEKSKSVMSCPSSVHFSMGEKCNRSLTSIDKERKFARASLKCSEPESILQSIDFSHIGSEEKRKTLISSRNSLELLREYYTRRKSSLSRGDLERTQQEQAKGLEGEQTDEKEIIQAEETELSVEIRDSPTESKTQPTKKAERRAEKCRDEDMEPTAKKTTSKLLMTIDSVEVIKRKESMMPRVVREKEEEITLKIEAEETITKITDKDSLDFKPAEPSRTVSITFTGRSVITETEYTESEGAKRKKKTSKHPMKSKKPKSQKVKARKGKQEYPPVKADQEDITDTSKDNVIMGDSSMNFLSQSEGQFTTDRIRSFINILKDHPNLIRLFTSVVR